MVHTEIYLDSKTHEISKSFLNGTLKEMMRALGADCGSLFLFDPQNDELVLKSFYNSHTSLRVKNIRFKAGEGVSGTMLYVRHPVLVKDIDTDPRFRRNGFKHYRTGSFMSLPLFIQESLFGLINLGDKKTGGYFTETDFAFAKLLTTYACSAIENLLSSSRIRRENDLLYKERSLLEKYASVGKLASGIVHEISNPLDGVIRFTNILLKTIDQQPITREYLTEIKKGLYRIDNITKSLLTFGRQFSRPACVSAGSVDVHRLIDEALDIFRGAIRKGIRIEKHYSPKAIAVRDEALQQVFINIIKNAFDAMPHGGTLAIRTATDGAQASVAFKDTGCGIPAQVQGHIFEPFFTTKGVEQGSGLGLSICKEIIDGYGGTITVTSFPGEGAEFIVCVPL